MMRTIEAVIEPDGRVRLLEPVTFSESKRALVAVLEEPFDGAMGNSAALLSESALADWARDEEDAAWAHLQSGQ